MAERVEPVEPLRVLFVCVHNAGRSQMAAAFARALGGERLHVRSAGSTPAARINPVVVEAMAEAGIDLSREHPQLLGDEAVSMADAVITMGCGDACPVFPGKRYLDWDVEDPAGKDIAAVRRIRDDVRHRVEVLLAELGAKEPGHGISGSQPSVHGPSD